MAFAADFVFLVDSRVGLQYLIDQTAAFLRKYSMALNNTKSYAIALFDHHRKNQEKQTPGLTSGLNSWRSDDATVALPDC